MRTKILGFVVVVVVLALAAVAFVPTRSPAAPVAARFSVNRPGVGATPVSEDGGVQPLPPDSTSGPVVAEAVHMDVSAPLSSIAPIAPAARYVPRIGIGPLSDAVR